MTEADDTLLEHPNAPSDNTSGSAADGEIVTTAAPASLNPAALEMWLATLHPLHRAGRADSTWRAYATDLAAFAAWCQDHRHTPLPAEPDVVMAYLADMGGALKLATLRRRLAAISVAHALVGHPSPTRTETVRLAWSGLRRTYGPTSRPRRVEAILTSALAQMVAPLSESTKDVRDRALLVVGFAGAFRRSELASLDVGDIDVVEDGLRITLRKSKTDQEGGGRIVGLPYGAHRGTCPVRSWLTWREIAGLIDGPAFLSMRRGGYHVTNQRMPDRAIADVIKARAAAVGLDPRSVSGHSLRSGFATSAARAGASDRSIMAQTGHRSPASLAPYVREGKLFEENAAAKLGL